MPSLMEMQGKRKQLKEYWRQNPEEFQSKGKEVYETHILPKLIGTPDYRDGNVIALDLETKDYAVHPDSAMATTLVLDRNPGALIWAKRIGYKTVHRWGGGGNWRESPNDRASELEIGAKS